MTMHRLFLFAILTICSTEAWGQGTHNPDRAVTASGAEAAPPPATRPCSTGGQIHNWACFGN
jgi:hypothetical protein